MIENKKTYTARDQQGRKLAFLLKSRLDGAANTFVGKLVRKNAADGRPLVVKELPADSADLLARFFNEAGLKLDRAPGGPEPYRYIAEPVFFGKLNSGKEVCHVFLSEFVQGLNLRRLLDKAGGRLPEKRAVEILAQLALGLDTAHSNNIIHRQLKPENVIVSQNGRLVKLTGIGMACFQSKDRLTKYGLSDGTAYYMSPEQVKDASGVDCKSDVFSLGVLFYELVTGVRPFDGASLSELYRSIVNLAPIAPARVNPGLSGEVDTLIKRMLSKNPLLRPLSMREVLAALPLEFPGRKLVTSRISAVPCPQCREYNAVDSRFCRFCGRDLTFICSSCDSRILLSHRFCRKCGACITRVSGRACLVGLKGGFAGKRIPIEKKLLTLGRHKDNELSFRRVDKYVSRFQARIEERAGAHWLTGWNWVNDCATTNGTYVNGVNIDGRSGVLLRDGDRVRIGDSFFRYEG